MAQLALAWLLAKEESTLIPIPGTKNMAHMKENAAAGNIQLSADITAHLDILISENNVVGDRYSKNTMAASDAEKD